VNAVLQTSQRLLLSITSDELNGLCNALNEVCHGVHIEDPEFETRLGVSRSCLADLLTNLSRGVHDSSLQTAKRADAWTDGGSVQAVCITVFGDPCDMSIEEARVFADKLLASIKEAGG
jgi:hypothetical protein